VGEGRERFGTDFEAALILPIASFRTAGGHALTGQCWHYGMVALLCMAHNPHSAKLAPMCIHACIEAHRKTWRIQAETASSLPRA
jgi:hypothetical protein